MEKPIDIRLRELIAKRFPGRGRFARLEASSKIPLSQWKNFVYRKQSATPLMLEWWSESCPDDQQYLMLDKISPAQEFFPFNAPVPDVSRMRSVGDRLRWVIIEWCGTQEDKIFEYLAKASNGRILPREWAQLVLGNQEPTLSMLEVVCDARPMFAQWVVQGTAFDSVEQRDPLNPLTTARSTG